MDTKIHIQNVVDYIENHLTADVSMEDIAEVSGFSMYHFCHVFSSLMGLPVKAFVTKRRLHHAIYRISRGEKAIDVALAYGFDTYAGFYKAFKAEFGCSISTYLRIHHIGEPKRFHVTREVSMTLTQTQLHKLLKNWPIDVQNCSIELVQTPKMNTVWTIGDEYILKSGSNISGLRVHIAVSRQLNQFHFDMALPILTHLKEDFIMQDDRYFVLYRKVKGDILGVIDHFGPQSLFYAKQYGIAIGQLHQILEVHDSLMEVNDANLFHIVSTWALPTTRKLMEQWGSPLPNQLFEDYTSFEQLYPQLKRHVIHRDMHPGNIIVKDNQIKGFIDFDISERNVRLFDICYCATAVLSGAKEEKEKQMWFDILKALICGYDSVNRLSEVEKRSIVYIIDSIQMIFIAWLDGKDQYRELAMTNRAMLVWLYHHREKIQNMFI